MVVSTALKIRLALAVLLLAGLPISSLAQEQRIEPDHPDLTNSAHLVPVGVLQCEVDGLFHRASSTAHDSATPFTVRYGITPWFEARVDGAGFLSTTDGADVERGLGNIQLGAKVRLIADKHGAGLLALEPELTIPTASADKRLGSGQVDAVVTMLTGVDFLERAHTDFNYGIGSLGGGAGEPRFAQQAASASTSVSVGNLSPYVEVYWVSRAAATVGRSYGIDGGVIYLVKPRVAIDGGLQTDLSGGDRGFSVFGGVSFYVRPGHPPLSTARLRAR
jgi:hypothetical protein